MTNTIQYSLGKKRNQPVTISFHAHDDVIRELKIVLNILSKNLSYDVEKTITDIVKITFSYQIWALKRALEEHAEEMYTTSHITFKEFADITGKKPTKKNIVAKKLHDKLIRNAKKQTVAHLKSMAKKKT